MNCEETRARFPEIQERALAEADRRRAEAHLSGCAPCREALAAAANLDAFLRAALPVPERAPDSWAREEARILRARIGAPRWIKGIAWGAAAALLLAIGLYVLSGGSTPATPPVREIATAPAAPIKVERPRPPVFPAEPAPPIPPPASVPDPRMYTFPRETLQADPAPASARPQEVAGPGLLPGDPDHLDRLTDETVEVGLADSSSGRVMGLIKAADGRLSELRAAIGARKETIAEDLAAAYTMICRQGISAVLADRTEDPRDLATARAAARTYAGWKVEVLAKLEPGAQGSLKAALREALNATRELAGQ